MYVCVCVCAVVHVINCLVIVFYSGIKLVVENHEFFL